jgi:hypothetical protein
MHSVPIKNEKNKKKNSPSFGVNSLLVPQEKSLTNNIGSSNNYIDNNYQINHKKVETPIEFIKQKKKFFMQDFFDIKGTNDFISSKELALKKIELNDEILIEEKKNKIKLNTKSISDKDNKYNIKESKKSNGNSIKSKKKRKRNTAICVHKHINIEDNNGKKKSNSKKQIAFNNKAKRKHKNKESNNNKDKDNNIFIIDNKSSESKDSNYFYKFIIDNANESDEKFHEKFEKIIEKYERESKKEIPISKAFTSKDLDLVRGEEIVKYSSSKFGKTTAKDNNFNFSEKIKDLMINDEIFLSSINNANKLIKNEISHKNNNKLNGKKGKKGRKIFFSEKVRQLIDDEKNDSLISVLDDLK